MARVKQEQIKQERITPKRNKRPKVRSGRTARQTLEAADRLHSAAIHLLRRVRQQDASAGIGPAQLSALSVLVFAGPKTLGELAAAEQIKPPTMSRIVAGLKRSRLAEITHDRHDARRLCIRATAKGARLLQQGRQRRIAYLAAHLDSLTSREVSQLDAAARTLENLLRVWR
jgi:DNA-binding MarR family transcriptional regulator